MTDDYTDQTLTPQQGKWHNHRLKATSARLTKDEARITVLETSVSALQTAVAALQPAQPPVPPPPPVDPPPATTVPVASIAALYTALAVDANTDITLAPGTYSGDVWLDSRFAARTKPCVLHLDGATLRGRLAVHAGAHDLDIRNPTFADFTISATGVIVFGGYAGEPGPRNISVRGPRVLSTVRRTSPDHTTEHAVYFSYGTGDWGDILIEDLFVDATDPMGIATAIHGDHGYPGDAPNVTARRVTARRTVYRGNRVTAPGTPAVQQPLILWQPPFHDWLFDGADIQNANGGAIRFESIGASNIVFRNVVSVNSRGFYSSMGANPPGVTFDNCSLA